MHEIFYVLSGVALKIALGLFHLRIAIERWHILVIKMIVIGTTAFGVASFFIVVFQCVPGRGIPLHLSSVALSEVHMLNRVQSLHFGWTFLPTISVFLNR